MRRLTVILLAVICLAACSREPVKEPDQLVVEGWIEAGEAPVVYLTTSLAISREDASLSSLNDHIVKWAKVTLSDGDDEVVLTGMASKRFLPPYAYTTGRMIGKAGKTYTLTVDYGEVHATASATIPEPRALDSIGTVDFTGSDGGSLVEARFTPAAGEYYNFFTRIEKLDSTYLPAPLGYLDSSLLGSSATVRIQPGGSYMRTEERVAFRSGETVDIKFCTMSADTYRLWSVFGEQNTISHVPVFTLDINLPGNVEGALGYFAGYGSTVYKVEIP